MMMRLPHYLLLAFNDERCCCLVPANGPIREDVSQWLRINPCLAAVCAITEIYFFILQTKWSMVSFDPPALLLVSFPPSSIIPGPSIISQADNPIRWHPTINPSHPSHHSSQADNPSMQCQLLLHVKLKWLLHSFIQPLEISLSLWNGHHTGKKIFLTKSIRWFDSLIKTTNNKQQQQQYKARNNKK